MNGCSSEQTPAGRTRDTQRQEAVATAETCTRFQVAGLPGAVELSVLFTSLSWE